jgi:TPR repeat protein
LDGNSVFSSQSHSEKNSPTSDQLSHLRSRPSDQDKAATADDDDADSEMIREEQLQRATKLLMDSAEMGYTNAQTALGQLFELREEYETAKSW